jgi:hypothetical protein
MMPLAIFVDLLLYALAGFLVAQLGRRRLPAPWNEPGFTIPLALLVGALVTMVSFPHWAVYPG